MNARGVLLAAVFLAVGCQQPRPPPPVPPPPLFPAGWMLVDLTRPLDGDAPYADHEKAYPFEHVPVPAAGKRDWRTGKFAGLEHQGTHLSSPWTRGDDLAKVADLAVEQLLLDAVVLDVDPERPAEGAVVTVTAAEIEAHERRWGKVPRGAIVLLRGSPAGSPALDAAGLELLLARGIAAVGSSAMGIDGDDAARPVERAAHAAGLWLLLGLGDAAALPSRGALVLAGAIPISGAAGAPARVVALVPPDERLPTPVPRPATRKAQ